MLQEKWRRRREQKNMNRRQIIAAAVSAPLAMAQNGQRSLRDQLIGSWRLISWEEKNPANGEISYPCGKNAVGRIMYDAGGRMAAQIMNPDRRKVGGANLRTWANNLSAEESREVLNGYVAYFGTFDIDETKRIVTHHVRGELRPLFVGAERARTVEFLTEDRIVLGYSQTSGENRLTWERERP